MRLAEGSVTLVIAGAWNPVILNPAWVAKYGLGIEGTVSVTMTAPVAPFVSAGAMPSYSLPGLHYTVNQGNLVLSPTAPGLDALDVVQEAAKRILDTLKHTPVVAVGFNAGFDAESLDGALPGFRNAQADVIDAAPDGWAASGNLVRTTLSKDGSALNVDKSYDGEGVVRLQINFHNPVTTIEGALGVFDRLSFRSAFEQAAALAGRVFNEELQNDANV